MGTPQLMHFVHYKSMRTSSEPVGGALHGTIYSHLWSHYYHWPPECPFYNQGEHIKKQKQDKYITNEQNQVQNGNCDMTSVITEF